MNDWTGYIIAAGYFGLGALFGLAYGRRRSREGDALISWAAFWPVLLVYLAWHELTDR